MKNIDKNDLICAEMKVLVKSRKAKATYTCVYKREEPYFWFFTIKPRGRFKYVIDLYIKLTRYDEFVTSITHPNEVMRFTDKMRYEGFFSMRPFQICEYLIDGPFGAEEGASDSNCLTTWCENVYRDAIKQIDEFICESESKHSGLNQFLIDNGESNPLMAGFASLYKGDYSSSVKFLQSAKERSLTFGRSFGSIHHDLRDVLLDYCKAKKDGIKWTRDLVLAGL